MIVTVILCIASTITFCMCARLTMALANMRFAPQAVSGSRFSVNARKFARNYATGAMVLLAIAAFAGAVHSYVELFRYTY